MIGCVSYPGMEQRRARRKRQEKTGGEKECWNKRRKTRKVKRGGGVGVGLGMGGLRNGREKRGKKRGVEQTEVQLKEEKEGQKEGAGTIFCGVSRTEKILMVIIPHTHTHTHTHTVGESR